jgi:hypothetical protein
MDGSLLVIQVEAVHHVSLKFLRKHAQLYTRKRSHTGARTYIDDFVRIMLRFGRFISCSS